MQEYSTGIEHLIKERLENEAEQKRKEEEKRKVMLKEFGFIHLLCHACSAVLKEDLFCG